jgi:choice-of-anchor B domain-containing protein
MKHLLRSILCSALAWMAVTTTAQINITFAGQLSYQQLRNSNLSNLWGYTDEQGNEYAIVGVNGSGQNNPGGVSVVSLADPSAPQEIFFFPGPPSIWREVKVWGDHAYITTEAAAGGLTIVDLSPLPQSTNLPATVFMAPGWDTSHSLFIDENGRLFIFGSSRGNGGAIMYDLTQDPMVPVELGEFDNWYVHDGYARGDTLYAAHILDGFFSIVDVSNPAAPVLLGTQQTPNVFTHNVWLDDSGQHLFTTDEKTNAYVGSYDVSDPTDIVFLDKLRSDNGSGAIPHNTYWLDHFLVTSYYTFGVTIYDAMRPHNLVEVGHYDTSPFSGNGFNGAWGVYPLFQSQRLIISDIEQGLVVLDPTYVRACWLEGTVTNATTNAPVAQATITITGPSIETTSNVDGTYGTGYHTSGTYTVEVNAPGYFPATLTGVVLENGEVTWLDVALVPMTSFVLQGTVTDALSGAPIVAAQVVIQNEEFWFTATTNVNGEYTMPTVFEGSYTLTAGRWGWVTACPTGLSLTPGSGALDIALQPGYYDDFALDLGWTVFSTATSGMWERGAPVGTTYQGQPSNPGADVPGDCGDQAYVTGNGGGGAGDDDVDDGYTRLTSPAMDLTQMLDPHVNFHRWFFNAGGSGAVNDRVTFAISNGSETVVMQTVTMANGTNSWQPSDIRILDHMPLGNTMRFIAEAVDLAPGHLVEAGLDLFRIVEMGPIGVPEHADADLVQVVPNPSNGRFSVRHVGEGVLSVMLLDATGRVVMAPRRLQGSLELDLALPAGTYLLRVERADAAPVVRRIVIQ